MNKTFINPINENEYSILARFKYIYIVQSMDISIRDFDVATSLLQNFNLGTNVH